jgi:hypothetical protein
VRAVIFIVFRIAIYDFALLDWFTDLRMRTCPDDGVTTAGFLAIKLKESLEHKLR